MISIDWKKFENLVKELIFMIDRKFDTIICINRGGLVVGRLLSEHMELPLGVISARSYSDKVQKTLKTDKNISIVGNLGKYILLVDDLVDTSKTIKEVTSIIQKKFPKSIIKTAVLYKDKKTDYTPDYYVKEKEDWIVFPYEK